jgi:hypothetical protein
VFIGQLFFQEILQPIPSEIDLLGLMYVSRGGITLADINRMDMDELTDWLRAARDFSKLLNK